MAEEELQFIDFKEHVQTRSMWGGANVISDIECWMLQDDQFILKKIHISEVLIKCIDEILVNAIDQYVRSPVFTKENGGPVTYIKVTFNDETGEITVSNDGKGIPVYYVDKIKQYSVQAIISEAFSGSNFDDTDIDRITGGINGLGMKIININSSKFQIETVDSVRQIYYKQICSNNMNIIEEPIIVDLNKKNTLTPLEKSAHTTITFIPDYAKICKKSAKSPNPEWINAENFNNFKKIIEARLYQTATFITCINYRYKGDTKIEYRKKAKIFFNDQLIKINSLSDFVRMFGITDVVEFEMSGTVMVKNKTETEEVNIKFPWTVCVGYSGKPTTSDVNISLINGVCLSKGGSHIRMLYGKIRESLQMQIDSLVKDSSVEFRDTTLKKSLFMVDVRHIPLPQFSGQTKDSITIGKKEINVMKKLYLIPEKVPEKIWKLVKDAFEYKVLLQDLNASNKKKKVTKIRKYEPAKTKGIKSGLFIPEGDAAAKPISDIITSKVSPINKDTHGMYNIQGVPPNVCKQTKKIMIDGEMKILQDRNLQKNITLNGLAAALNLDYTKTYYYGPIKNIKDITDSDEITKRKKGDAEFKTLNYGYIIIASDQDIDGIGCICSLVIVYILRFWPELVKRCFVKRFQTPLIRMYMPNSDVLEFYSANEHQKYIEKTYGCEENIPEKIKLGINYYKGLGGHSDFEVENMGININKNILQLTWNECCEITMNSYYGESTSDRKDILLTPVTKHYSDKMIETQRVPISTHFEIESKSFQLYFMRRKLKSAIDGLIPAQRKALAGGRIMFQNKAKAKVYQLTGYVAEKMHYAHGDTSMNGTIIKLAQNFTGSNNIPIFVPISNGFGSRKTGRAIAASPRYIDTTYNRKVMDLIYPPEDDWLLEYIFEDGKQSEPKNYVPIIPYSILETSTTPGVGWAINCWGRDYTYTMRQLRRMIEFDYPKMRNDVIIGKPYGFLGKAWIRPGMRIIIGKTRTSAEPTEICLGEYTVDYQTESITITQLPLKIWSYKFKCNLLGINHKSAKTEDSDGTPYPSKDHVIDVRDDTGNDKNEIIVKFKPGSLAIIMDKYGYDQIDPIEDYLQLYQVLKPQLNMFNNNDSITEFKTYEEVIEFWYVIRKDLYLKRLDRQRILIELEILYYEQILLFIDMDEKKQINIDKKDKDTRDTILLDHNFVKFNKTNLLKPRYIKTAELRDHILKFNASYKYIDAITKGMTEQSYIVKEQEKIDKLKVDFEVIKNQTWDKLWLSELDTLDKMVAEGIKTKWLFNHKQYKFKSGKVTN